MLEVREGSLRERGVCWSCGGKLSPDPDNRSCDTWCLDCFRPDAPPDPDCRDNPQAGAAKGVYAELSGEAPG